MTRTADLLTVLHQIDAYKGKTCATCKDYQYGHVRCALGHQPVGDDDGCDDWTKKPPLQQAGGMS
jgi:hypothetical protein